MGCASEDIVARAEGPATFVEASITAKDSAAVVTNAEGKDDDGSDGRRTARS